MSRKLSITNRFTESISTYDLSATLQAHVAETLKGLLPALTDADVLELGCGTGILTGHLLHRYPDGRFLITDISSEMVHACKRKYAPRPRIAFTVMDCDTLMEGQFFDIVVSSMTLQWSDDPVATLDRQRRLLKPGGHVIYCTLGPDNFPEWRETLAILGYDIGLLDVPHLPGIVCEERIQVNYGSAQEFLIALKRTGASQARPGYRPLAPSALRRARDKLDQTYQGKITWNIVYGILPRML
jgi:malonyl-CoA O-methyltransferase